MLYFIGDILEAGVSVNDSAVDSIQVGFQLLAYVWGNTFVFQE